MDSNECYQGEEERMGWGVGGVEKEQEGREKKKLGKAWEYDEASTQIH